MKFKSLIRSLYQILMKDDAKKQSSFEDIREFEFNKDKTSDIKKDISQKYRHNSDLLEFFAHNRDLTVHKWHHYIPIYNRYFEPY